MRGGGWPGYSFIFASGRYDGFSPCHLEAMLEITGRVAASVEDYRFTNVGRLADDYRRGRFAVALGMPPRTINQRGTG